MGKSTVANQVEQIRKSRGVGASDLARRVNVSRQTIYAIEAGTYVPNTEVALNIARELEVTVDELFSLNANPKKAPESIAAEMLSNTVPPKGQPVRICQIGSRWVSVPVSATPYYMPEADGIVKRPARKESKTDLLVFAKDEASQSGWCWQVAIPPLACFPTWWRRSAGWKLFPPRHPANWPSRG
ncbi:MAG: helix-turn-helix transcriptional regulator [Acidobacteriota bacterium]